MTLELTVEIRKLYSLEAARSKKLEPVAIAIAKAKAMTMSKANAMEY